MIHLDMPEAEYAAIPALRSTFLRAMLRTTPRQAFADDVAGGAVDSHALQFGRMLHCCVLEPERFEREAKIIPEFAGKGSRALKAEWLLRNAGQIPVKQAVHKQLLEMRDAVHAHPVAGPIFKAPGRNEVSAVWDDPLGFKAKSRIDRAYQRGGALGISELKSTRNAAEDLFRYDCGEYGYYVEAAMQLRALDVTQGAYPRPYHFVAVEKMPPYRVEVYELRRSDRARGTNQMLRGMEVYAECLRTGEWPDEPIFSADERSAGVA